MEYTTQLYRDCFINHDIRIPSLTNQDFPWKVKDQPGFLGRGSGGPPEPGLPYENGMAEIWLTTWDGAETL